MHVKHFAQDRGGQSAGDHAEKGQKDGNRVMPPPQRPRTSIPRHGAGGQIDHQPVDEDPEAANQAGGVEGRLGQRAGNPKKQKHPERREVPPASIQAQTTNMKKNRTTLWQRTTWT